MIKKNTLILLAIMVVFVVGFVVLDKQGLTGFLTKKESTSTPESPLFNLKSSEVGSISYQSASLEDVLIRKDLNGGWEISTEGGLITPGAMEELLSAINGLKPSLVLDLAPEGTATGLNDPSKLLIINVSNAQEIIIKIGNLNPTNTGYYVQIDFQKVVLINKASIENVIKLINTAMYPPTPTPGLEG